MVALTKAFRVALICATNFVTKEGICYKIMLNDRTLEVATDASGYMGGISDLSGKNRKTVKYQGPLWNQFGLSKQTPIYKLELFVVIVAVKRAPRFVNLRLFSDSHTCIFGIPKNTGCDAQYSEMLRKLQSLCGSKGINLVLKYVNTENNPADDPSRKRGYEILETSRRKDGLTDKVFNFAFYPM